MVAALSNAELLRAVRMRHLLRGFGKVLSEKEGCERTFDLSRPVRAIGIFLSHSWSTPGWFKTVALMYYANVNRALFCSFFVATIFWGLEIAGVTESLMTWQTFYMPGADRIFTWSGSYTYAPPCLVFFVVLMFGQEIPFVPQSHCFLDKCCIHQTDPEKKNAGIQLLGTFLQSSNKLVILWQPEYLTRLWCVYELAAFRHIKGSANSIIEFLPLKLPMLTIGLFFFHTAATTMLELTFPLVLCSEWHAEIVSEHLPGVSKAFYFWFIMWFSLFIGVYLIVGYFLWNFVKSHMDDRRTLLEQLRNFKVSNAHCLYESDRAFVEGQIRQWFGTLDNFEKEVQVEVGNMVAKQLAEKEAMPWGMIFVGAISHVFFATAHVVELYRRQEWYMMIHMIMFDIGLSCFSDAIAMSIGLRLAESAPTQTPFQKVKGGLIIAALFACTTGFAGFTMSPALPLYVAIPCFCLSGLLTYVLFGTALLKKTQELKDQVKLRRLSRSSSTNSEKSGTSSRQTIPSEKDGVTNASTNGGASLEVNAGNDPAKTGKVEETAPPKVSLNAEYDGQTGLPQHIYMDSTAFQQVNRDAERAELKDQLVDDAKFFSMV